jgi:hypothetical protein
MTLVVLKDKLVIALKTTRPPVSWITSFLLLGNSMMHSRVIPARLVLPLVILYTFTFSIPLCISTCGNCDIVIL